MKKPFETQLEIIEMVPGLERGMKQKDALPLILKHLKELTEKLTMSARR